METTQGDVDDGLFDEMGDEPRISTVVQNSSSTILFFGFWVNPRLDNFTDSHMAIVESFLISVKLSIRIPLFNRSIDVQYTTFMAPLKEGESINLVGQVNEKISLTKMLL